MHIGIAGPVATDDVADLVDGDCSLLPCGYGGAPVLATLIDGLLRRGHRVSAFTLSTDLPLRRGAGVVAAGPRFELHYLPMRPKAWPFNGWRPGRIIDLYSFERRELRDAIRKVGPDVIHAHWAYEFAWASLCSGLPHVVTCHDSPFLVARYYSGSGFKLAGYRWLRAAMAYQVLRRASDVTTVSPYTEAQIRPLCRTQISVVPNPIGDGVLALQPQRRQGTPRILLVCNGWDRLKNAKSALKSFSVVATSFPEVEFSLVGSGFGPGEQAERWWRAEGLQANVNFLGRCLYGEVLRHMSEHNILVHPSLEESFGATVAEAMAAGMAVVAGARSGAVPWVVGSAGLLVDVSDHLKIAEAIMFLLDNPQMCAELGSRGKASVTARFSVDGVAAQYEDRYLRAIANGGMAV